MSDAERLRNVVLGRLESLQRAGAVQMPRYCPPADKVELGESAAVNASALPAASSIDDARVGRTPQLLAEIDIAVLKSATSQTMTPSANKRTEAPQVVKSSARKWASDDLFTTPEAQASFTTSAATLSILDQEVASCTRCDELAAKRTQTVFGVGNPKARLCFMGEAPGADEDRLGEPFVGRAGQLLNKIIEACRLKREDVYILNMIKCRPPGNRNPLPHELQNCRSFLDRQLELIEPEFICCLGAVASQNLLNTTTPISKLRGKLHAYREIQVVCTFHPAYLLRNPAAKKDAWEDLKFLMREMGVNL